MLTLTWKQFQDPNFRQALITLNNNNRLDNKTAYRVGRICIVGQKEMEKLRDLENTIRAKYIDKDEKGSFKVDEAGNDVYNTPDGQENHKKEFEALLDTKVEMKVHKLDFNQVNGLSGLQLTALEEILDNLPEEV